MLLAMAEKSAEAENSATKDFLASLPKNPKSDHSLHSCSAVQWMH
jgi:hypothetical protein